MAINFRDLIIDRIEELLVWGPDNAARVVNQSLQLQASDSTLPNMALSRSAYTADVIQFGESIIQNGYFSRLWKVEKRPSTSINLTQSKLAPIGFIFVNSGSRPADIPADFDSQTEALLVGIDVVLWEGFGVQQDSPNQSEAQAITQQVNAFVTDFDVLFNGIYLEQTDFSALAPHYGEMWKRIRVVESGIVDWAVGQEVEAQGRASEYEILTFSLQINVVYPHDLTKVIVV